MVEKKSPSAEVVELASKIGAHLKGAGRRARCRAKVSPQQAFARALKELPPAEHYTVREALEREDARADKAGCPGYLREIMEAIDAEMGV